MSRLMKLAISLRLHGQFQHFVTGPRLNVFCRGLNNTCTRISTRHLASSENIRNEGHGVTVDAPDEKKKGPKGKEIIRMKAWKKKQRLRLPSAKLYHRETNEASVESHLPDQMSAVSLNEDHDRFGDLKETFDDGKKIKKRENGKSMTSDVSGSSDLMSDDRDWGDVFGTMADSREKMSYEHEKERFSDDEDDLLEAHKDHMRLSETGRKHTPNWYANRIQTLFRQKKIVEAVAVLEEQMLEEDRVMPTAYVFSHLIAGLARVGYTKKVFKLFNKMKQFGLIVPPPVYTSLFTACSNSPWREDGLKRADYLREHIKIKDLQLNPITYNSMVKTYSKLGELQTAFMLVDEMIEERHKVDAYTFSSLLMACVSDKEAGMKHAIEVWRRLRKRRVQPLLAHYNLLLHAARDCRVGDSEFAQELLGGDSQYENQKSISRTSGVSKIIPESSLHISVNQRTPHIKSEGSASGLDVPTSPYSSHMSTLALDAAPSSPQFCSGSSHDYTPVPERQHLPWFSASADSPVKLTDSPTPLTSLGHQGVSVMNTQVPNLLNPRQRGHPGVVLGSADSPWQRLAMLGGLPGILSHMEHDEVKPDIRTFTMLLELLPPGGDYEVDILSAMKAHKVRPDMDFFNFVIRRKNKQGDFKAAKLALVSAVNHDLTPTIQTFGCLAMGCSRRQDGLQLLEDVENAGLRVNIEIIDILMFQTRGDFFYKLCILQAMKRLEVLPNVKLLSKLEKDVATAKRIIVDQEKGKRVDEEFMSDKFADGYRMFMKYYTPWLKSTALDKETHPWAGFQKPARDRRNKKQHTQDDIQHTEEKQPLQDERRSDSRHVARQQLDRNGHRTKSVI